MKRRINAFDERDLNWPSVHSIRYRHFLWRRLSDLICVIDTLFFERTKEKNDKGVVFSQKKKACCTIARVKSLQAEHYPKNKHAEITTRSTELKKWAQFSLMKILFYLSALIRTYMQYLFLTLNQTTKPATGLEQTSVLNMLTKYFFENQSIVDIIQSWDWKQ